MKKIIITGASSYVGISFKKWVEQWPEEYSVDTISLRDNTWMKKDFAEYDVVLHMAGIAHVSTDPKMEEMYFKVNRDLTIQTAEKAKADHVEQFIFMSSIIVYGDSSYINRQRIITKDTIPKPANFYGESKLQAEEGLKSLENDAYKIVVVRPPMIYGKGSKGNYPKLSTYAKKLPFFPNINNQRSMLHIDNLCEFLRLAIDNKESGLFFPQNDEYVSTSEMVKLIAQVHGKKIRLIKFLNPILRLMGGFIGVINKAFGNLVYEKSMSEYKDNYRIRNLEESIVATELERNLK